MCPKGHYLVVSECKKCPQGYASPGIRQTFCSQCTAGREQPIAGKSVCHDCAPGKYSTKSVNIHCELCPTGQYQHLVKQGQCNDCRPGKYTDSVGQITCKTCALGKYVGDTGAVTSDCQDCPKGWQGISDGTCAKCPESTYQDEQGQTACKKCTTGTEPLSPPAAIHSTDCFDGSGLTSYVFDVETDGKDPSLHKSRCEIRPNMVLVCPACSCNDNARDGYWDGPVCDECRHGFAGGRVGKCLIKCPGYDGVHDSTMCGGNGKCWFGKYGSGECLCGGKNVLDASSNNIVVNVKTCPAGHRCSGYGDEVLESTKYIPFYYILEYRQYSVFVLQLNLYTPERGHMWFERYSPQTIYENVCATCTGSYDGTEYTQIGHFSDESSDYTLFSPGIQVKNGFHGENCQHECAMCLNSGHCLHVPHPFYYSYSITNTHETFSEVFVPQTQCICSSDIYDADAMCCPHGFEPYVYFGKRQVDPYFHHTALPFITNLVNVRKTYWTDEDLWLKNNYPRYKAPINNKITVSNLNSAYEENTNRLGNEEVDYLTYGPYTKHVFYGTEKEMCRACPGLFGKGVVSRSVEITSEQLAEDFWWDSAAKGKKCNGLGVCDFYLQRFESDNVLFMGDVKQVKNTKYKLEQRFTGCAEEGTPLGKYTGIVNCIANHTREVGTIQISEPYYISGYIGQQSIVGVQVQETSGTPSQTNQAPWGYVEKDNQKYEMNQTSGFTSIPVPDANGEYLFHPWDEGECRYVADVCTPTKNKLYSIYKIGITGQGDDRLVGATFDRFDTCFTYDDGTFKTKIGNYVTETYENGQDPFLGKNCPKGHFCTKTGHDFDNSVGFKEACPAGYYQPNEAQTRTDTDIMCSRLQVSGITKEYQNITEGRCEDIVSARGWTDIETKTACETAAGQNVSNVTATNVPRGCYYNSGSVYFNNRVSSNKCSVSHKCTCVRHGPCQLHKGTQDPNDLVDSVCIRCNRNEYSKEGSAKCTACPQGRVKKISSIYGDEQIDTLTMLNMPSNLDSSFTPWYFIPEETGVEMSDCALVPNGIIHVPLADKHMNYEVPAFLPVVSCPFGYSSRPGTYVIWGHYKIVDRLQTSAADGVSFIHAPFIQDKPTFDTNLDGTTHLPLALDYCFRCPTNAMTSAGSMTCATCFANTLKFYLKDAIGQLVESTNLGNVTDWVIPEHLYGVRELTIDSYDKKHTGHECSSDDTWLGNFDTEFKCFQACANKQSCLAFVYGNHGGIKAGNCYHEIIQNTPGNLDCRDPYELEEDTYDFYVMIRAPIDNSATIRLGLGNNIWIVALAETGGALHMFKIKITGVDTYETMSSTSIGRSWTNIHGGAGSNICFSQATFVINCFYPHGDTNNMGWYNRKASKDITTFKTMFVPSDNQLIYPPQYNIATPFQLSASPVDTWLTSSINFTLVNNKTGTIPSLGTACIVCNAYLDDWQEVGFNIATGEVACAYHSSSINYDSLEVPKGFEVYRKEVVEPVPSWPTSAFPLCAACSPGQFTSSSNGGCEVCVPGKYTATMSDASLGQCKNCPIGYHQPSTGMTLCFSCNPGQFQNQETQRTCRDCPRGFSQSFPSAGNCTECSTGETQPVAGTAACNHCTKGRFGAYTAAYETLCPQCPKGWAQASDHQSACVTCAPGKYQDGAGETDCNPCSRGRFSSQLGRTSECEGCPKGYFAKDTASSECEGCDTGQYQDSGGQSTCKKCQTGSSCSSTESNICRAGQYANPDTDTCDACPTGYISAENSATKCDECGINEIDYQNTQCQDCGGHTWEDSFLGYTSKNGDHRANFANVIKNDNHDTAYCTWGDTCKKQNKMICFASWTITMKLPGKICFKKKSNEMDTSLAIYVKPEKWNLDEYWTACPSSSVICKGTSKGNTVNGALFKGGAYATPFWWKTADDNWPSTTHKLGTTAPSRSPSAQARATSENYDWDLVDRIYYQEGSTFYDNTGEDKGYGTNPELCSEESYKTGDRRNIILIYYGGYRSSYSSNRAGVLSSSSNFAVKLYDDIKCAEKMH